MNNAKVNLQNKCGLVMIESFLGDIYIYIYIIVKDEQSRSTTTQIIVAE